MRSKTALWFSGGKDSMACLFLMKSRLKDIEVLFVNTGKYYPEQLETVASVRELCKNWHEVWTDREGQWIRNGLPSDLVPIDWTQFGQQLTSMKPFAVQSYLQCCWENIGDALLQKSKELGVTDVIRGQRLDDGHRAPAKNGSIVDGIAYHHPIENWTKERVLEYLRQEMGELPGHYALEHSSLDCYDCTAYTDHSADRVEWMRVRHPKLHEQYASNMGLLRSAIRPIARSMEIQ